MKILLVNALVHCSALAGASMLPTMKPEYELPEDIKWQLEQYPAFESKITNEYISVLERVDSIKEEPFFGKPLEDPTRHRCMLSLPNLPSLEMPSLNMANKTEEFYRPLPATPPAKKRVSILNMTPGDVSVVMAMGDSITAAFGAENVLNQLMEFRGKSFSMGSDPTAETIPNFLRNFNPRLMGMSSGHHPYKVEIGSDATGPTKYIPDVDNLNAAQSGSRTKHLNQQLDYLLWMLRHRYADQWEENKILTIYIGSNDQCSACHLWGDSTRTMLSNIYKVLQRIRNEIPNVLVNVIENFKVSNIKKQRRGACNLLHNVLFVECLCAFAPLLAGNVSSGFMDKSQMDFNWGIERMINDMRKYNSDSFAVTYHPLWRDLDISELHPDLLSTFDCFHPSVHGQKYFAVAYWNSIFTPLHERTPLKTLDGIEPLCVGPESIIQV